MLDNLKEIYHIAIGLLNIGLKNTCLIIAMVCVILYACGNKDAKKYIYSIPGIYMIIKYLLLC